MKKKSKLIPPIPQRENHGSYLRKRKGSNFYRIFGDTNTRWFFLEYQNEYFGYKNKETEKKIKGLYKFSELKNIREFMDTTTKSNSKEWKYGLEIELINKRYLLFAQTEEIQKKWIYEFKIILRLVPESFPLIDKKLFKIALEFYERPYLEALKKQKEEKKLKLQMEREEKLRNLKEEKERRQKEEEKKQEELRQRKEEEKLKLEEENRIRNLEEKLYKKKKIKYKNENEIKPANIYEEDCESIIKEAIIKVDDENVFNESLIKDENNKNNISQTSLIEYNSNLQFKEDLNDWDFYNDEYEKISPENLDKYNPIQRIVNANKKPQLENVNFIKTNTINQKLQNDINIIKKTKNKIFKKNIEGDGESIFSLNKKNNNPNQITISENNIYQKQLFPNTDLAAQDQINKKVNINNEQKSKLIHLIEDETKDSYKINNHFVQKDDNLKYLNDSKLDNENVELNLSINSNGLQKNQNKKKINKYDFENSINTSNSIIDLNEYDQIPNFLINEDVQLYNQNKTKKPKNFTKIIKYKNKDQGKKLLQNSNKDESYFNKNQIHLKDGNKMNLSRDETLNYNEENFSVNDKLFNEEENKPQGKSLNKIYTDLPNKKEYNKHYKCLDLSEDWNMESLNQDFNSNVKYDLEKNDDLNNKEKISRSKAMGPKEKENTSDYKIETECKSIKKNESSYQSYKSDNLSKDLEDNEKSRLDFNLENKYNDYKNKKIANGNKNLDQFKNYKKIFLPDLEDLRKERNNKNEGSFVEEHNQELNKSKNSCSISNNNLGKNENYNSNNSKNLILSNNNSYCVENIIKKNDNPKNKKKYFNAEDDFDFEEKETKKDKLLTKENLKKPKENPLISNWLTNKNIPSNKNFYTNKNDILTDISDSNIDISAKNMNKSQIYEFKISNEITKKNIYLETLNDQEYEGIYDKKNKSFNNIGENISDISNSNLSAGALSPINKGNSNFYFLNNNDLNFNNHEDELLVDYMNKKKSIQNKFSEDFKIREPTSRFNNNKEKTNISNDALKIRINKELNDYSKQVRLNKLENNEEFVQEVFKNNTNLNINNNNNQNIEKKPIESLRDKIYNKKTSNMKIEEQIIFDEQDELDKVLSKPLNIDKKIKGKNTKIIDHSKNVKSSNENFVFQNNKIKQNSFSKNEKNEQIFTDKNLGKYNNKNDSQFNQNNFRPLFVNAENHSQDEAKEFLKNNKTFLNEHKYIKNNDDRVLNFNANEMSLVNESNFIINTEKNNDDIYSNGINQINPFINNNHENFNNNIDVSKNYDNKIKKSEEINNNKLLNEIEQDSTDQYNLKSSKFANLKTSPKINLKNEFNEFQKFDFDNFSLGGKKIKESQTFDKNDDINLNDFTKNNHDQGIKIQSKTFVNNTPTLDGYENKNNFGKKIQKNTKTEKNDIFSEDLTDDW